MATPRPRGGSASRVPGRMTIAGVIIALVAALAGGGAPNKLQRQHSSAASKQ